MSPSEPPTVLYVCKVYPRFSETFIVSEVRAREAAGEQLEIVSLRTPTEGRFHASLADVRAPVHYLDHAAPRVKALWDALRDVPSDVRDELLTVSVGDAAQALALADLVVARGIDHLHAHFGSVATTVARLAAMITRTTYSFTAHAKDLFHEDVVADELRVKLADAHHVVTVSEHNVRFLRDRFGEAARRVRRVYNGIDLDAFTFAPDRDDRPVDVVAVGRLVEKKGFDVLLAACARARDAGTPLRCRIVGTGERDPQLRRLLDDLDLHADVELVGALPQDRVREEIRRAKVMAVPCVVGTDGNADGLPTVILEAMALGTPVVATPVTGIPEAVRHDDTGLLVAERDADALADALRTCRERPELRRRLAVAARHHVEATFGSDRQARELRALLPDGGSGAGVVPDVAVA